MNHSVILLLSEEFEMVKRQQLSLGNYSNSLYFFIRIFQNLNLKVQNKANCLGEK